eukprot:1845605-Pyramimonas_sp.AAC.1
MRSVGIEWLFHMWVGSWQALEKGSLCHLQGAGLFAPESRYALAGDQDAATRHEEILRGANEPRDL